MADGPPHLLCRTLPPQRRQCRGEAACRNVELELVPCATFLRDYDADLCPTRKVAAATRPMSAIARLSSFFPIWATTTPFCRTAVANYAIADCHEINLKRIRTGRKWQQPRSQHQTQANHVCHRWRFFHSTLGRRDKSGLIPAGLCIPRSSLSLIRPAREGVSRNNLLEVAARF